MSESVPTIQELLQAAIAEALTSPRRASGDSGEVEMQSIKDLLEMQKYLASGAVGGTTKVRRSGLRFSRFVQVEGTVGGPVGYYPGYPSWR